MSDTIQDIKDVAEAVGAAGTALSPVAGAVTAAAKTADDLLSPVVKNAVAQKYEKESREKIAAFTNLLASDSPDASALDLLLRQYLADAGQSVPPWVSGDRVIDKFPLQYLTAFVTVAIAYARDRQNAAMKG